ncbi:unnamed protein product [Chondrus crispus]|uniref:Uncharacterized protein n=1 Tax=Chondrus crispus TaxID=2769 RepID=R7QVL8_CHOCR|nr:unnamed protein product [Chondrus crispus]CDF41370.1 unnamed protein product [Chondrus crispus]|eukprot:XP_005711664.1 unnamed protein product [Chondrus crispus]
MEVVGLRGVHFTESFRQCGGPLATRAMWLLEPCPSQKRRVSRSHPLCKVSNPVNLYSSTYSFYKLQEITERLHGTPCPCSSA